MARPGAYYCQHKGMLNEFPHAASKNKQFFQSGIHQHSKLNEAAILAKKISISPVRVSVIRVNGGLKRF